MFIYNKILPMIFKIKYVYNWAILGYFVDKTPHFVDYCCHKKNRLQAFNLKAVTAFTTKLKTYIQMKPAQRRSLQNPIRHGNYLLSRPSDLGYILSPQNIYQNYSSNHPISRHLPF